MSYQRDFDKVLKVGVVGAGSHCYRNILPLMNYLPVEVVAISDPNEEAVKKTARQYNAKWYTSSEEMYQQNYLDAVFICVGPKLHPDLVCEAFRHNVNVWVEKPIATRAEQVDIMIAARGKCKCVVGLKKAFSPACYKIEEIVHSPEYGNLKSMLATYPIELEADSADILKEAGTPNMLRNGVHPFSFLMQIGGPVKAVTTIRSELGFGTICLEFANGIFGQLHLASGLKPDFETYSFFGDKWKAYVENASIRLDRGIPFEYKKTTNFAPEGFTSGCIEWSAGSCVATLESKALFVQGFYNEAMYFCDCVLNNITPERGSLEFAREVMKVYEAVMISNGKRIVL